MHVFAAAALQTKGSGINELQRAFFATTLLTAVSVALFFPFSSEAAVAGSCTTRDGRTGTLEITNIRTGETRCTASGPDNTTVVETQSGTGEGRTIQTVNHDTNVVTTQQEGRDGTVAGATQAQGTDIVGAAGDLAAGVARAGVNAGLAALLSPIAVAAWLAFKIAGLLLGFAGVIFNLAVAILVFGFGKYLGNTEGMLLAWSILRDFGNIGLVFGFVYMGIRTILDIGHYSTGKSLASLVIFAVLLNFSLFTAQAVIDTTNVLAAKLYQTAYDGGGTCNWNDPIRCVANTGIAGQILQKINITSVHTQDQNILQAGMSFFQNAGEYLTSPLPFILKYAALTIVVAIAAFVFFAGAFMLISRAVVLAFLMVTSPIGFAGMAIPPLKKIAEDWWQKLIDQALFAPVFLLLLLASLKMTDGLASLMNKPGGLAGAITATDAVNMTPLLFFALIIGFMIASLMIASRFGIYFADVATKSAGGIVFGTMGMIGRATVGRGANYIANRVNTSGNAGFMSRRLAQVAKYGASASFDMRSATPFKQGMKTAGVDAGKPSDAAKKGFRGETKASNEAKAQYAKDRKAAWDEQDTSFKGHIESAQKNQQTALAYADDAARSAAAAERMGDEKGAEKFREREQKFRDRAEAFGNQKKSLESEWEEAKNRRITKDEKMVDQFNALQAAGAKDTKEIAEEAAKAPGAAFDAATKRVDSAAAQIKEAATKFDEASSKIARLEQLKSTAEPDKVADIERAIRDTAHERERAEEERSSQEREWKIAQAEQTRLRAPAEVARAASKAAAEAYTVREAQRKKYEDSVTSPQNALNQVADAYQRLATTPGTMPVRMALGGTDRLFAARDFIRKEGGKTHGEKLAEEIAHMMDGAHGGHGDGDDHGGDHGKKGGGKKADAHGGDHGHG